MLIFILRTQAQKISSTKARHTNSHCPIFSKRFFPYLVACSFLFTLIVFHITGGKIMSNEITATHLALYLFPRFFPPFISKPCYCLPTLHYFLFFFSLLNQRPTCLKYFRFTPLALSSAQPPIGSFPWVFLIASFF